MATIYKRKTISDANDPNTKPLSSARKTELQGILQTFLTHFKAKHS